MTDLSNFDLSKMLYGKLAFSDVDKAILKASSELLHYVHDKAKVLDPMAEKPEWLLDNIAIADGVDFYDKSFTVSQKMLIIKNSDFLKSKKGTPIAVERALSNIFLDAEVLEWFDYDGQKGHFKVYVTVSNVVSPEIRNLALKVIEKYKRKSQILDELNFKTVNLTASQRLALAMQIAQIITLNNSEV
ncbi:phage tail protein [Rummeliibacillus stabekisii]|uniref:Phage tail protein I n=1 Tax=Rummeliibacillus stabekisii TaxID=241244 RepID=A0A143HC79_9BACL|nr:phage tail protein [Rummeliibacillus stabekisii]AMW99302.1 hypothetical protein ATY39_07385 [Rummeliibacillus stabekisii]